MQAIGAKACYFRKLHGSVSFEGFQLHFYLLCRENSILARCVFWIPFHCKGNVDFNKLNMLMGILSKNVVWFAQLERNLLTIWQVTLSEHFCLNLGIRPPHSQTRRLTKQNKNKNKTKQKQKKDQSSKAGYWNLPWKYRGNSKKWSKKKQENDSAVSLCRS